MKKAAKFFIFGGLFFFLGFLLFTVFLIFRSRPKYDSTLTVQGLNADVRIVFDRWSVPHIFAQNEPDLFWACGYVHAQERMWQMDITRRAGFGRLSEIFGRATLEKDRHSRTLGLKEAALNDYRKLVPEMKHRLILYSQGVNAWLQARKWDWPPEFLALRYRPEPWTVMDCFTVKEIMSLILCTDYRSEAVRGRLVAKFGYEKASQILEQDLSDVPFAASGGGSVPPGTSNPFQGSNNWVLAGRRTESRKPLLACDPHLELTLPSVWYEIHLHCPTLNVVGASLPGVPLVIIGHNDSIAWGMTNSGADVQDLFIEELDETNDKYRDREGWKILEKKEEEIRIRGEKDADRLTVLWTSRGPIITPELIESEEIYSLKWTIHEGGRAFEGIYNLNKARNWEEFSEALRLFDGPSQNFVYADLAGNIGYYLSGKIPVRRESMAVFPHPGWLGEDWEGYLEERNKPNIFNPGDGFIATANHKVVPDGFTDYVSLDWMVPFRYERIRELIFKQDTHTVDTVKKIQLDVLNKKAELFLPLIDDMDDGPESSDFAIAKSVLKGWDLRMADGKAPALFEIFLRMLNEEVFKDQLGEDFDDFDLLFRNKWAGLLRILSDPRSDWFDDKGTPEVESREDMFRRGLTRAYRWLLENIGPAEKWNWTEIHSLYFHHSMGEVSLFRFLNRGPFPVSGNAVTVNASYSADEKTQFGASFRQIVDLSDWDESICVLTSGQSGHFLSPFYDDQIPLWLEGKYRPMIFSKERIDAEAGSVLWLKTSTRPQPHP